MFSLLPGLSPEKSRAHSGHQWLCFHSSYDKMEYAKPAAAVNLAHNSVEHLDFKEHKLTDAERAWASAKFSRDWKDIKDKKFFWWVRERYIIVIGVAGDTDALPTLKNILAGDVKDRCVYYAINAITRLTREDKRDHFCQPQLWLKILPVWAMCKRQLSRRQHSGLLLDVWVL